MKGVFRAEAIGLDTSAEMTAGRLGIMREMTRWHRPWVAELTGLCRDRYERRFLRPKADYTDANSKGTRGVWFIWTLNCGPVYETRYRTSWREWRHRFLIVTEAGEIKDVTEEEVRGWLANVTWGSTS